jgi:hypothetical protein
MPHPLHPKSLLIDVYCRTLTLVTSKVNLLIVIVTILHSNIAPLGMSLQWIFSIIDNDNLRKILAKGPKYREPKFISWKYNFKLLMDSVEDYARYGQTRKRLSEWVKVVSSLIQKTLRMG